MAERARVYRLRQDSPPVAPPQEPPEQEPLWREAVGQQLRALRLAQRETSSQTAGMPVSSVARWVRTTTVRSCAGTFDHAVPLPPSQV